jgi:hypothetical protein
MSIEFGLSRLRAYSNGWETGAVVSVNVTNSAAVASGSVWIGGKACTISGGSSVTLGAGYTGHVYFYAYLPVGNSSTANFAASVINPKGNTAGALLSQADFGTGANTCTNLDTSGTTGMRSFGRAMNCTVNVSYDSSMARGGNLVFPTDMKLYNGTIEGTLEYANISGANLTEMLGASWVSGGAGSGTMTVTATQKPLPFMIESQQITDGVTGTIRILKCYSNQITLKMDRENYTIPSLSFQAIANQEGDVMTWNI